MKLDLFSDSTTTIHLADLIGHRFAILGQSGYGKTNSGAVMIEEMFGPVPGAIVDIEGEYWPAKEMNTKRPVLVAGKGEHVDFVITTAAQADALARLSHAEGIWVILDLSGYDEDAVEGEEDELLLADCLLAFLKGLWEAAKKQKRPYQLIVEEAHEFIPESGSTKVKGILNRIASRGRKRGIGTIAMSQRSAKVSKDFISQSDTYLLHKVTHPSDMKVYKDLIPLDPKAVEELVGSLEKGEAVLVHKGKAEKVKVRLRHTYHAGATPELEEQIAERMTPVDHALLERLASLGLSEPAKSEEGPAHEVAIARIAELERELAAAKVKITELEAKLVAAVNPVKPKAGNGAVDPEPAKTLAKRDASKAQAPVAAPTAAALKEYRDTMMPAAPGITDGQVLRNHLLDIEQIRMRNLYRKLTKFTDRQKRLLAFLVAGEGRSFPQAVISQQTGLMFNNPGRDYDALLKEFVTKNGTTWASNVRAVVHKLLPGVKPEVVLNLVHTKLVEVPKPAAKPATRTPTKKKNKARR